MIRALFAAAVLALGATQLSCNVNDYCLNCHKGDGGGDGNGTGDAAGDASLLDAAIDADLCIGVGNNCPNQVGECAGGVEQCTMGHLTCTKNPSPEVCDGKDNDCNGMTDEGDPGGGGLCASGVGECKQGVNHCISGAVQCVGAIGPTAEVCDGKDNDCDGTIDEGLMNLGACGTRTCVGGTNAGTVCMTSATCTGGGTCMIGVGECKIGQLECQGGGTVCIDPMTGLIPAGPSFEICDLKDNDCDGIVDEGFNLNTDPANCGMCNHVCGANLANMGNAVWGCSAGGCVISSCQPGYHDNNNNPIDGCEFGPCFSSGPEVCDGVDNDCDGVIDETPGIGAAPAICATAGECAGTVAQCPCANTPDSMGCASPSGWKCTYGATVSTDGMGNIIPETKCDGLDNDCNGIIDDNQPPVAHADGTPPNPQACNDGNKGVCKGTGVMHCDDGTFTGSTPGGNLTGPAKCDITMPGGTAQPESCNNLDDDCDGFIDNDVGQAVNYKNSGNLPGGGQQWINIGGGRQMMKYEASEADATATSSGNITATVCSKPSVIPWSNIKYPAALAACQAIGATLCTEQQWHRACSVINPTTYPLAVNGAGTLIEAEDYSGIAFNPAAGPNFWSWSEDKSPGAATTFSGMSDMVANPNTGTAVTIGNATTQSPRLDFQINFTAVAANYHVWVRMLAASAADGQIFLGVTALAPPQPPTSTLTLGTFNDWTWVDSGAINIPAVGVRTVSLFMGTDGAKVDAIFIKTGAGAPNPALNPVGNQWAYANPPNPNVYSSGTCNDQNFQATPAELATGSLASCYANDATLIGGTANDHAFDLSGNLKEWTLHHEPGQNPIRGGSYNNTGIGTDCPLAFTLADDTFFFPNVGFRCCR